MPYTPLKNIDSKIKKKINELNLICPSSFKQEINKAIYQKKKNFILQCNTKFNVPCILKVKIFNHNYEINKDKLVKTNFKKEISFYKIINDLKHKKISKVLSNFIPKYIDSGDNIEWLLYKKVEGIPLGNEWYQPIKKQYWEDNYLIDSLVKIINEMRQINIFANEYIPVFNYSSYKNLFKIVCKRFDFHINQINQVAENKIIYNIDDNARLRIYKYIEKNKDVLNKNQILTHGDLHPCNILLNKNENKIYFIDWEKVRFDNIAAEMAMLWIKNASSPDFREKVFEQYFLQIENKDEFMNLYRVSLLTWLIQEIGWWQSIINNKKFIDLAPTILDRHINDFNKHLKEIS